MSKQVCVNCSRTTVSARCDHCGHRNEKQMSIDEVATYLKRAKTALKSLNNETNNE